MATENTPIRSDSIQNENGTQVPATVLPTYISKNCYIDPPQAFILVTTSGALILILLIAIFVLTCKVITLKQRYRVRHPNRSNVDLVSRTGYWGTERTEGGIVGPCETNLLLEEVRSEGEDEETHDGGAERAIMHQGTAANTDADNVPGTMQVSTSRDSCIDPMKELEDTPLVV